MLIVQSDSGNVDGANGYVSVDAFKAYHAARGNSYGTVTDDALGQAIIRATDYLDGRFRFVGRRYLNRSQTTQWPRIDAFDVDRRIVLGIPLEVVQATCEYALRAITVPLAPDPVRDDTGALVQSTSEKVGPVEERTTYVDGAVASLPKYPVADQKMRRAGLILSGGELRRG